MNWKSVTEIYFVVVFTIALILAVFAADSAFGAIPGGSCQPMACNQRLYDAIYKVITREALAEGLKDLTRLQEREVSLKRYSEIMSLRALCNGQKSSYEKGGAK